MATQGLTGRDLRNAILFAAFIYVIIRFISQIIDVLLIFSVTALLSVALDPAVTWLEKRKVPRGISAGLLALLTLGAVALVLYLIIPPLIDQLTELWSQIPTLIEEVQSWMARISQRYPTIARYLPSNVSINEQTIRQVATSVVGGASRITASVVGFFTGAFVIFISTIYVLANPRPLLNGLLRMVERDHREHYIKAGRRLREQIVAWVQAAAIGMLLIFVLTWIAMAIIGLKQAFLFGVIAGLLEIVPIIGPILSAIPPIIVALLQNPIMAIWVVLAFIAIQQIENHLIIPLVMSKQLSLHPVTVIFAVLVMGGLFGIIGIFLAAPTAFAAGIIYEEILLPEREEMEEKEEKQEESTNTQEQE